MDTLRTPSSVQVAFPGRQGAGIASGVRVNPSGYLNPNAGRLRKNGPKIEKTFKNQGNYHIGKKEEICNLEHIPVVLVQLIALAQLIAAIGQRDHYSRVYGFNEIQQCLASTIGGLWEKYAIKWKTDRFNNRDPLTFASD